MLGDFLMALHSLTHLELRVACFLDTASWLPIVLPNLQFLKLDDDIAEALHTIRATRMVVLLLVPRSLVAESVLAAVMNNQFPALQHLIFRDFSHNDLDVLAQKFPSIERLTCKGDGFNVHTVLTTIPRGSSSSHVDDRSGPASHQLPWSRLNTIAVSSSVEALDAVALCDKIRILQDAGHPIRKLLLPPKQLARENADALLGLRGLVETGNFSVDWPTPFVSDYRKRR
ncbi:hypothetical protein FIBSPDRAFT_882522 [Athelia psychrophila]|uniref:F-box domain-containing protein n=1 Tax=Athelia psychrophila TaxID=1759441 RepID=A0A166VGP1_9AGAM|nr:hypothetical protein FIBSPDRAFT_882522 [Fibularhizoctonia sp. CBS 109695]